jgi:hypothetical protein
MGKKGSLYGTRKGLKRKYFFAATRQKRLERKARFFAVKPQKMRPNFLKKVS